MRHVKFLQPWGRNAAVRIECTCGTSHGLASFRDADQALASGYITPAHVTMWGYDQRVSRLSRSLAYQDGVMRTVREAWTAA